MTPAQYGTKHGLAVTTVRKLIREGKLAFTLVMGRARYDIKEDATYARGKPGRKANPPSA